MNGVGKRERERDGERDGERERKRERERERKRESESKRERERERERKVVADATRSLLIAIRLMHSNKRKEGVCERARVCARKGKKERKQLLRHTTHPYVT